MKKNMLPIIGLLTGAALIVWSIMIAGDLINFFDAPSIIITVFGSFAALMICFPFKTLLNMPKVMKVLLSDPEENRVDLVNKFSEFSKKARRDGLLALEDDMEALDNEYMAEGLKMVIDGVEPDAIKDIMELKLDTIEARHGTGQQVFEKWGELAPAFGMVGTLIGLVIMLSGLDDPDAIGPGMATALLTTFYGSVLANLIFLPMASNLSMQTEQEMFTGEMILEGILQIQSGANPRLMEEKLKTYLSTEELELLAEAEKASGADGYE